MCADRLSRNKNMKIPKTIKDIGKPNTIHDLFSVNQGVAMACNKRFNKEKAMIKAEEKDAEWEQVSKIAEDSSDLIVITKTKKLGAYIVCITQKSPTRFRGVFVNRMINLCLDALQDMLHANFIRQDILENKNRREQYQSEAIIKLKILGYVVLLAENSGCILRKQYKQVSIQLGDAINLCAAWRKSDNDKWENKKITTKDLNSKGFK